MIIGWSNCFFASDEPTVLKEKVSVENGYVEGLLVSNF